MKITRIFAYRVELPLNSYVTVSTAEGAPKRVNGRMAASKSPGLGIRPKFEALGKPVVEIS